MTGRLLAFGAVLLSLATAVGCSRPTPVHASNRDGKASMQEWQKINARIDKYGVHDKVVWKYATDKLTRGDPVDGMSGGLVLQVLVGHDAKVRSRALELLKKTAMESKGLHKLASFETYWRLIRPDGKPLFLSPAESHFTAENAGQSGARSDAIAQRKSLTTDDRDTVLKILNARDELGMGEAMIILIQASELDPEDRGWGKWVVSEEVRKTSGPERDYWKLVQQSLP